MKTPIGHQTRKGDVMTDQEILRRLLDRQEITDTLYRYAAAIDVKDYERLRSVFTDDVVAQYAGAPEIQGADKLTAWIREMSPTTKYQHHLLNVYEVEIHGDEAHAYTYHTSHQVDAATPDSVYVIVARYRDVLRRVDGRWLIADKRMEVGWMERREYSQAAAVSAEAEQNLAAQAAAKG
jgi:ketosteroid isomerase-like protein